MIQLLDETDITWRRAATLPDDAGGSPELIREDVFYAVAAAFDGLHNSNPVVRLLAEQGHLDSRCTSGPVLL